MVLVQSLLKKLKRLLLCLWLLAGQVNPPLQSDCVQIVGILINDFLNDLACPLQLFSVPVEGRTGKQISVSCHLFSLVQLQRQSVNGLLIDIPASFVIIDQSSSSCE
jgi:hypothetical protein